jgi:hypothetical protein
MTTATGTAAPPPAPGMTVRRALGLGTAAFILLVPVVADLAVKEARQRRVVEEASHRAREAATWAREALSVQTQGVSMMTENAIANPRFLAAVRGHVDGRTFADLLATESWWQPYRGLLAAISYDGATLAYAQTVGGNGVPIGTLVQEVATSGKPVSRAMFGERGAFLVAARPVPLAAGERPAVLLLARRLDDETMEAAAARLGSALMLSDGRRSLAQGGAEAGPLLGPLVGKEQASPIVLPQGTAEALAISPGLWVWALGRAAVFEQAAIVADRSRRQLFWGIAIPLAALVAVASLRRGRGRDHSAPAPVSRTAPPDNVTQFGLPTPVREKGSGPIPWVGSGVSPERGMSLGRYVLIDRIGEGGMAEVFTAISFGHGGFRRSFVVKRLRGELNGNPNAVRQFIDEANLASTLVHPNVVPVFDFGEASGTYYLAQEYVVGRDLGRLMRRLKERGQPTLSTEILLYVASEILSGLEYAHEKRDDAGNKMGLVHRDVTPENVIISDRGEVRILDFGIVKAKQRLSQTVNGTVKGNLEYMSPEQARGKEVDARSDLFSAGLVVFHAASGEPFYAGETFYELLSAAAIGPTPEKRERIAKLAPPLPAILARALDIEPAGRYQTAAEFKAAITPHLRAGGQEALAARVAAMFGDELRAEQDRLANAFPRAPYPEPFETSGGG